MQNEVFINNTFADIHVICRIFILAGTCQIRINICLFLFKLIYVCLECNNNMFVKIGQIKKLIIKF